MDNAAMPGLSAVSKGGAAGSAASGSGSSASADAPALRLDSGAVSTPLFTAVTTRADGTGSATFTAPTNLGTFVIRWVGVGAPQRARHTCT